MPKVRLSVSNIIVKYHFLFLFLVCLFLSGTLNLSAQDVKYGLEFSSFEVVQEKRTGLNLSPSEPFSFPKGFSLSFDVNFQSNKGYHHYGYVFRMIGQSGQHIDFLLNRTNFIITHSLEKTIAEFSFDEIPFEYGVYYPFEIRFEHENNTLNISFGEKQISINPFLLKDFEEVYIVFGKCNYSQHQVSDIPKMRIKDIRINDHIGSPVYHWVLSKHTQNGVYDNEKKQFASVENPQWILDTHSRWKTNISLNTGYNPQICYNPDRGAVSIFDQNNFYSYDINTLSLQKENLNKKIPNNHYTNQIVYNPFLPSYYSYFDVGDVVDAYDPIEKHWSGLDKERIETYYWHHNKFISPSDSNFYVFGGYGHYKYSNEIQQYNFKTQTWKKLAFGGDFIPPRYLSGLGVIDENRALVFGGYGSEDGAQELSPRNFYDLYIIDVKENTVKKIWELSPPPAENFAVANSMVVDTLNKCFYALCFPQQQYNTSLFIGKFSLENPEYEVYADSIPYFFRDIHSYADLFLDNNTNELVAVTSSSIIKDSASLVLIYTLSYPPVLEQDLFQEEDRGHSLSAQTVGGIFFGILLLGGIGIILSKKKKGHRKSLWVTGQDSATKSIPAESKETADKHAIFILGGYQIIDKKGSDITSEFSPLLKQLFLILLLNTLKDGNGISSEKLREIFWFDKTPESARNNRGVLLSRLRQILEQVGSASIENQNSYWTLELGSDIFCDYSESIALIKKIRTGHISAIDVRRLLTIVSRGEMMQSIQVEWLDSFKAEFSNNLIDVLLDVAHKAELQLSLQEHIDLADAIFIHDFLNENALKLKCKTLIKMKKNGLAKKVYDSFVKEYQNSFGVAFKDSFEQIVS